jgi:molybdopterin-guanine dinucleotide biosynthesis protein A
VNAYVLVGGRSRRMGASKVELFLERIVAAARPVFDEVIAVDRASTVILSREDDEGPPAVNASHATGRGSFAVSAAQDDRRIRTIFEDAHDLEGAIFGVVRALREARGKCFLLAVDYPLITTEVLEFLRDREGMPEWNGRPQPLCAVWDAAVLPRIEERIARGEFDLRGAAEMEIIAESELRSRFSGEPLLNVNTPEEWERAQRFLASR